MLSGYRIMWMLVMFDLPVGTDAERKAATRFRTYLLDEGFEMAQFSVYMRCCGGREVVEAITGRIRTQVPPSGLVTVLPFTDRQYANMSCFTGRKPASKPGKPEQFSLF
jgi:CRISPR-associated protein Cas2